MYTMDYGDLKSITLKENMLSISFVKNITTVIHTMKKEEFIGVCLYDSTACFRFIHYPALTVVVQEKHLEEIGKVIKELFGQAPKDGVGDLLAA
jgi:hypothetical protein